MKFRTMAALAAAGACVSLASAASADVVTFDDAASSAALFQQINSASFQGLTFTSGATDCCASVWNGGETPEQGNGTNNLIFAAPEQLVITRQGGGLFDLSSLDMTLSWYTTVNGSAPEPDADILSDTVTVIAETTGGQVVQMLTLGQGFQTYDLGLTGVSSLSISRLATAPSFSYWGLDNLSGENFGGAVPEPATWAMMILGFGGAGAVLRRRRAAVA